MSALLTNSRTKVARVCQRKEHYEYGLGYRPVARDEALYFGDLFHKGLEAWWKAPAGPAQLDAALAAVAVEADPYDRARAEVLLIGYDARWADQGLEVLGVEVEFRAPLINPATSAASRTWTLAGKLDALVRDGQGRTLIVEHKTSSEDIGAGSGYWARLRMDGQVSIYFAGARALGHDVHGCLYDVIAKPGLRPLKSTPPEQRKYTKSGALYANQRDHDETPEEYRARLVEAVAENPVGTYQRAEVVRLESELEEFAFDLWQQAQQIREAQLAKRYPRNPDACIRFGKQCPFFEVCSGAASLDDARLFKRLDNVHPELSAAQAAPEAA